MMDDPISALDPHVKQLIVDQVLLGLCSEKTRVLVTHSVDMLQVCDRVIVMKKGRVIE